MKQGDTFTHQFQVTEAIWQGFQDLFGDKNPIHTDSNYAKEKNFQDIITHGNILNGFLSYFIGELLPIKNVIIHTQEIKYLKPVYLNDALSFQAEVVNFSDSVQVAEMKYSFQKESGEKVAKGNIQIGII